MGKNKILLIEPPFYRLYKPTYSLNLYPLALGYLAGTIKKDTDWDIVAYNADFTTYNETFNLTEVGFYNYLSNLKNPSADIWKEVRSVINEFKPHVIGISAKSQNFKSACIVARLAKEICKDTIVIVGGPHPSMVGKETLTCPDIDICVKGEGEKTIVELLNAINRKEELENIRGIAYRTNGDIVENSPREYIQDLDTLCFPHESAPALLKDYHLYPKEAFELIFASRGCPHDCFFCGSRNMWSQKVRFRSPENIVKEIKSYQQMGQKSFLFRDDYFGITKKYVFDLCNTLIEQCPGIKWGCELHIELVDDETVRLMKKAGCFSIRLGIESGNNEILKKIRKNITIEEALAACKTVKKQGINLNVFYMVGFPQETEKTLMDTFKAMKKTPCDTIIYSIFTPYPGTEAFELCKKQGLVTDDYDVALYNHQSPLNYFCPAITKDRFKVFIAKLERTIDKKNRLNRTKYMFPLNVIWQVKEIGIRKSLHKVMQLIRGK